jgi:hemolysin-activating ACP:hemolysin acyltransferase
MDGRGRTESGTEVEIDAGAKAESNAGAIAEDAREWPWLPQYLWILHVIAPPFGVHRNFLTEWIKLVFPREENRHAIQRTAKGASNR